MRTDVAPGARPAATALDVEHRLRGHSIVRLRPRTGRTHQLHVHLAHAGHPIVGDPLYGRSDAEFLTWSNARRNGEAPLPDEAPCTMLHAARLVARADGVDWSAPLPADFVAAWDRRRNG